MRIELTSVMVEEQGKALDFYTRVLRFVKNRDLPAGEGRWLTVVAPDRLDGPELLLEPLGFPPARTFQKALKEAGIPLASFAVDDAQAEFRRLRALGVRFTMEPTDVGPATIAILDDTCGNLVQIVEVHKTA